MPNPSTTPKGQDLTPFAYKVIDYVEDWDYTYFDGILADHCSFLKGHARPKGATKGEEVDPVPKGKAAPKGNGSGKGKGQGRGKGKGQP